MAAVRKGDMEDLVLVLDFNKQYAAAAAIKLRGEKIYCRIIPGETDLEAVMAQEPMGLILAGGIEGKLLTEFDGRLLRAGIPVLALGDAAASVAKLLSGKAEEALALHSVHKVRFMPSPLTSELAESDRQLRVIRPLTLSKDLLPLAEAGEDAIGFMHATLPIFGLEFQIEPNDPDGTGILLHFAQEVCGCSPWWSDNAFISFAKGEIAEAAGDGIVACVMDGGLKSGVAAMLAHQAVGDRLRCVFVDHGLLREGEADGFMRQYRDILNLSVIGVSARDRFLEALAGKTSVEDKRRAIQDTMQAVLAETLSGIDPQVLVRSGNFEELYIGRDEYHALPASKPVIEPLRELFRDEIRTVGEALGLPAEIYSAQPFPSTGLALRIVGEVTAPRLHILRGADALFENEIRQAGLSKRLWKFFVYLYPIPYETSDAAVAMGLRALGAAGPAATDRAIPSRLPYDLLEQYVSRVREAFPEVKKVFYDITPGEGLATDELV